MDLSPLASLLFVLLIAVMLIFAFGTQRNVRRGNDLVRWLQGGLGGLGKRSTFRWLGSSAVVMRISQAADPFREAEVVVVLEPRDVSFLWAWARTRGRRDFLILRGWLRRPPRYEVEAGDARGWTGGDRLKKLDWETWHEADWDLDGVRVALSGDAEVAEVRRHWDDLAGVSGGVWRLSIRREHPHLEIHLKPPTGDVPAERLVEAFRELGNTVARTN